MTSYWWSDVGIAIIIAYFVLLIIYFFLRAMKDKTEAEIDLIKYYVKKEVKEQIWKTKPKNTKKPKVKI